MLPILECRRDVAGRFSAHAMLMLVLLWSALMAAQTTISTGSIQGVIMDASGAVVAGAKVTITDKSTGQVIAITSTSSGTYSSGALTPSDYDVRVEAKGFKTSDETVSAQVGVTASGNFKLQVGEAAAAVEVQAGELQVNTEQATVQGVAQGDRAYRAQRVLQEAGPPAAAVTQAAHRDGHLTVPSAVSMANCPAREGRDRAVTFRQLHGDRVTGVLPAGSHPVKTGHRGHWVSKRRHGRPLAGHVSACWISRCLSWDGEAYRSQQPQAGRLQPFGDDRCEQAKGRVPESRISVAATAHRGGVELDRGGDQPATAPKCHQYSRCRHDQPSTVPAASVSMTWSPRPGTRMSRVMLPSSISQNLSAHAALIEQALAGREHHRCAVPGQRRALLCGERGEE